MGEEESTPTHMQTLTNAAIEITLNGLLFASTEKETEEEEEAGEKKGSGGRERDEKYYFSFQHCYDEQGNLITYHIRCIDVVMQIIQNA